MYVCRATLYKLIKGECSFNGGENYDYFQIIPHLALFPTSIQLKANKFAHARASIFIDARYDFVRHENHPKTHTRYHRAFT